MPEIEKGWLCGMPLQLAAKYVGIVDMALGTLSCAFLAYQNRFARWDQERVRCAELPTWAYFILASVLLSQAIMGIPLYFAAVNKSRSVLLFWLCSTAPTALLTGLPIRLYQMLIVSEFSRELKEEQEGIDGESTGFSSHPITRSEVAHQPPPPYNTIQQQSSDRCRREDGLRGCMEPTVAHVPIPTVTTNQLGLQIHGSGAVEGGAVPPTRPPPPRYDALGAAGYERF